MSYTRYTISVGLNDKDTKAPRESYERASLEIAGRLAQLGQGATITKGTGTYKHEDGTAVIEDNVIITIIDIDGSFASVMGEFIDKIKLDYNQESVIVMIDQVVSELR